MGRKREEHDPDRFLTQRGGVFQYKRRVPTALLDVDERAPMVRISLGTSDRGKARAQRDIHEKADDAYWASLTLGDSGEAAKARYKAAIARAAALGFSYRPAAEIAAAESVETILKRIESVLSEKSPRAAVDAALGIVKGADQAMKAALEFMFDAIVPDELAGKSPDQKQRWKNKRRASVATLVEIVGDKRMSELGRDDGQKLREFWMKRVAPAEGLPTHTANFANQNVSHLRTFYRSWFDYMGMTERPNPFDGLSFAEPRVKPRRPPFSVAWITGRIMDPGALAGLNGEARGILLAMVETGARPSEVCNLQPEEIRLDHPVPHISVAPRPDPEDPREIKTAASIRIIPLVGVSLAVFQAHPKGFPRYHDRGAAWSNLVNKFLRVNKLLETPRHKAYSLRHAFEDRMKDGGLDEELRRILMGHADDRPKYGEGGSLEWRRDQLARIALPFDNSII